MKIQIKHKITAKVLFECEALNMKVAIEIAIKASANLRYANLRYADLSYANLRYADLRYADLSYADLRYADLRYADLSYADLSYANLRYANLRYADLRYADLDYTSIPMWCGTLKGVKVDFNLVCQMLLHVFALECEDKRFKLVKKAIEKYAKLSTKWEYYKKA